MDSYEIALELVSRLDQDGLLTDSDHALMVIQAVLEENGVHCDD